VLFVSATWQARETMQTAHCTAKVHHTLYTHSSHAMYQWMVHDISCAHVLVMAIVGMHKTGCFGET